MIRIRHIAVLFLLFVLLHPTVDTAHADIIGDEYATVTQQLPPDAAPTPVAPIPYYDDHSERDMRIEVRHDLHDDYLPGPVPVWTVTCEDDGFYALDCFARGRQGRHRGEGRQFEAGLDDSTHSEIEIHRGHDD